MEKLKCLVPENLKRRVAENSTDDLPSLSSSLLHLFLSLPQFHQLIAELAADPKNQTGLCGKNKDAALDLKQKGNQCYSSGDHSEALRCYSQALRLAPMDAHDIGKNLVATLYLNRASLFHKMDLPMESLRDCSRALEISPSYPKVILKHCRETHCHYCLNELPADTIPCISCSLPLYCSQHCQVRAGGQIHVNYSSKINICEKKSNCIDEYIPDITVGSNFDPKLECIPEHKHECQGVHWPAILPSDVVLAGRVVVKSIQEKGQFTEVPNLLETLGLCESYSKMPPESKLELHIYSIVLLFCLQHSYNSELSINGDSTSRIVILLSQIRVNSMAIVRMKSSDFYDQQDWFQKFSSGEAEAASSVEQVRVGQALYKAASLFNHSCQPNIHAYFISRSLLIRTTEFVAGGCPLELSYGPQVGQWDCKDRLRFLEEDYFFRCWCRGCSVANASDLVISGFCCVNTNCSGVVLDNLVANCEKQKPKIPETISVESHLQVHDLNDIDIKKVAHISLDETRSSLHIDSGYCLKCGSYCNLASRSEAVKKAWIHLRRLQDSITSKDICSTRLSDALRSLGLLRSILHAYNKGIAEAEDNLSKAFFFTGDLKSARDHCIASIEILEKLYGPNHIVIGYELVKLSSIQLSLGDCTAVDNINRLSVIFSKYYGPHAGIIFPYLLFLERESCHIIN